MGPKMTTKDMVLYDTTLRDGEQRADISFSAQDKTNIARRLDEIGIDYIEGGFPAPDRIGDLEFFRALKKTPLRRARLVAFGMTRRPRMRAQDDPQVQSVLAAGTRAVCIVGKSWDLHVRHALRATLQENLEMIADTVRFFKRAGREVIFDAEHFFNGFSRDDDYALQTIKAAEDAGADTVVLCDTNGGSLPSHVTRAFAAARNAVSTPLGIHAHNESDLAVANTLAAVDAGATHVQGTINGYGERCGNANLCSIIPNLQLKMGKRCLGKRSLASLYSLSHYVTEVANLLPLESQPYVGRNAFAHKGGLHLSAVLRRSETYEHIHPELVGNERRLLVSRQAGASIISQKARELRLRMPKDSPEAGEIVRRVKAMEHEGYEFESAEASLALLMKGLRGKRRRPFRLEGFRVIVEKKGDQPALSEATIMLTVRGEKEHTAAEGDGPVHALDQALRKALEPFYPELSRVQLTDFKVRVIEAKEGTAGKVRVLIQSSDGTESWGTVGLDTNIIQASWDALVDSVEYALIHKPRPARAGLTTSPRRV